MDPITYQNDLRSAANMAAVLAETAGNGRKPLIGNVSITMPAGTWTLIHYLLRNLGKGEYSQADLLASCLREFHRLFSYAEAGQVAGPNEVLMTRIQEVLHGS